MEVNIFGIHLNIDPVAFTLPIGENGWSIYWYGIIIATGFLLAIIYGMKYADRFNINKDKMLDIVLVATPVAILSARLYFCVFPYANGDRISSVSEFFGVGSGSGFSGLAIYGGIIGAFVAGFLMCKIRKVKVLDMFDLASIGFLIGQGIGRWGNFTNQEAFGAPTGSNWFGMSSEATGGVMVHPCFLYESIWCIAGFFILNALSKKRRFSGEIFLMYGAWYGFGRFFIEYLRSDSLMIGKMKVSMLISAIAFIACVVLLIYLRKKTAVAVGTVEYQSLFKAQMDEEEINSEIQSQESVSEEIVNKETAENNNVSDN